MHNEGVSLGSSANRTSRFRSLVGLVDAQTVTSATFDVNRHQPGCNLHELEGSCNLQNKIKMAAPARHARFTLHCERTLLRLIISRKCWLNPRNNTTRTAITPIRVCDAKTRLAHLTLAFSKHQLNLVKMYQTSH